MTSPDGPAHIARYLVQHLTILLSEGVQRVYWYLARDYADFDSMGLVSAPDSPLGRYAPAPSYAAYAVSIGQLNKAKPLGRVATDPRTRIYRFDHDGEPLHVAWAPEIPTKIVLAASQPLQVIDMMGNARTLAPKYGRIRLPLDENPVYIRGPINSISEPDRRPLRANSVDDFPKGRGWSYGARVCRPVPPNDNAVAACLDDPGDNQFQTLDWVASVWNWSWRSPQFPFLEIGPDGSHPSAVDDRPVWAVRRWTASEVARIRILLSTGRLSSAGGGTELLVLRDGKTIWQSRLSGTPPSQPVKESIDLDVKPGTQLDFVTAPAVSTDMTDGWTDFQVYIERER